MQPNLWMPITVRNQGNSSILKFVTTKIAPGFLAALKKCLVYMSDQVDGPHGLYTACFQWSNRAFAGIIRLFVTSRDTIKRVPAPVKNWILSSGRSNNVSYPVRKSGFEMPPKKPSQRIPFRTSIKVRLGREISWGRVL